MSWRVVFLPKAEQDLEDIEKYLAQFYTSTVRNFFTKLQKEVRLLADFPCFCPAYDDDPYFRQLVLNDYLLFYSVDEHRHLVIVHRLIHARRDIHRQISTRGNLD